MKPKPHPRWENLNLEDYRQMADPEADKLTEALLAKKGKEAIGSFGYNVMLMLADKLEKDPELGLIRGSKLSQQTAKMPKELISYFDPMPAPEWIDRDKLRIGSRLWQENTASILVALYAASLPACYLMKNGIPALYKTEKLRDHRYIFQRIYETGLMLEAAMDADGIEIIEDVDIDEHKYVIQALQNLDAEGHWQQQGNCLCRTAENAAPALDPEAVREEVVRLRGRNKLYLWGKGYIAAKKVRFLHASMRFMLTRPNQCPACGDKDQPRSYAEAISHRTDPWDAKKYGVPVNQEDLAYTLLTFGYIIPRALKKWGLPLSLAEKESFLHLWRLIGHIMGLRPELMTDDWNEAEALFNRIAEHQAGSSEEGAILTEALMGFLGDYLPKTPGIAHRLSAALIIHQLGKEHASFLLDPKLVEETMCFWRLPIYFLGNSLVKAYLFFRVKIFKHFSHFGRVTTNCLHQASEMLIESWRDAYVREPFFVPANETTWRMETGVDEKFLDELKRWRGRVFANLGAALGCLSVSVFGLSLSLPIGLLSGWPSMQLTLIGSALAWMGSLTLMLWRLPAVFKSRPRPASFDHPVK